MAISIMNCAIALEVCDGHILNARIALGAVAPTVIRATNAEIALTGSSLQDPSLSEAPILACSAVKPIDDLRASAAYRSKMVENVLRQELLKLAELSNEVADAT
jgi:CO/xanthine dehydrogenase FAD-binding subunit